MTVEPWHYDTAEDLDKTMVERLRGFPREPDLLVYSARLAAATLIRGWLRVYHRLQVIGGENLPRDGSFVLVANHCSHLDALTILAAMPIHKLHRVFPAAAQDFFFVSIPRLTMAAVVVNALPFNRQANIRQSLSLCRQLLDNPGNVLLLFPEGTRMPAANLASSSRASACCWPEPAFPSSLVGWRAHSAPGRRGVGFPARAACGW